MRVSRKCRHNYSACVTAVQAHQPVQEKGCGKPFAMHKTCCSVRLMPTGVVKVTPGSLKRAAAMGRAQLLLRTPLPPILVVLTATMAMPADLGQR